MPVELWGASGLYDINMPDRSLGNALLLLYALGLGVVVYYYQSDLRQLTTHRLTWTISLALAAFSTSQLIPFPFSPFTPIENPAAYLTFFAAIPVLLAAAILPPVWVLFVGAAAGLGQAVGETHELLVVFHYAFTAVLTAVLMQQNYMGQVYRWLREPVIAGALSGMVLALCVGIPLFTAGTWTGLTALDRALVGIGASFWPRLLEGVIGGGVVMFVLRALPDLTPKRGLVPSPAQRSLQKRLTLNYIGFTAVLLLLTLTVLYMVAVTVSTRLVADQISQKAAVVAAELIELTPTVDDTPLDNIDDSRLRSFRLAKSPDEWMRIVNGDGAVAAYYPTGDGEIQSPTEVWSPEESGLRRAWFGQPSAGEAFRGWQETPLTRELVVVLYGEEEAWLIVTAAPYTAVLQQAWSIGWPLLLVILVAAGLFYANVLVLGRSITAPINEMVDASKLLAEGGSWSPAHHIQRDDEIGMLQQAFAQMQRSMRKRLSELSLLLEVSHDVAVSIDINQGIPAILRGALRGTGAVGARAVVPNPTGGNPLTFGEGPIAERMAVLDRAIMTKLRHASELMLTTPEEIQQALSLDDIEALPVPVLLAIPLRSHDRFQGILWMGFRQTHIFDLTERNLLSTLSTQAAVLVENARLFSTAESGRRRLAAVLASTSDAVIVTDQTERILLINRAAERIFDLKANQVRNRPVADVIHIDALIKALTGQDERPQNVELSTDDGKTYNAIASTIFSNEGQVFGRVAVLRDITYLKEIDEMKSDFVATVSHDLRSPLTFMRGYATMLPMVGELTEKQSEYIDKILGGIDQMAQLVDDLLDLGRIEAGVDLVREVIEIRLLLKDIASDYWQHAHMAGIQIEVEVTEGVTSIIGDNALIRRALTNLVGNGIKYAPNSGLLTLRAESVNGDVIISVKDNGPGISKDDQIRIFEKFYRVKERGTEKIKGSGLGLAIVKTIAEKHGGHAWVQSQRGKGTTFFISLPAQQKEKQETQSGVSVISEP